MWKSLAPLLIALAAPVSAADVAVQPGAGSLANAIAGAAPGDVLTLSDGIYDGPITIDRTLTLTGTAGTVIDGGHKGTVVTITGDDVVLRGVTVTGSGGVNADLDSGIKI